MTIHAKDLILWISERLIMDKINLYEIILSTGENNHKYKAYLEKMQYTD